MNKPILNKALLNAKQVLSGTALAALALLASGCASMATQPNFVDASTLSPEEYANAMYIARVERYAQRNGIDVQWVNAPQVKHSTQVVATIDEK